MFFSFFYEIILTRKKEPTKKVRLLLIINFSHSCFDLKKKVTILSFNFLKQTLRIDFSLLYNIYRFLECFLSLQKDKFKFLNIKSSSLSCSLSSQQNSNFTARKLLGGLGKISFDF